MVDDYIGISELLLKYAKTIAFSSRQAQKCRLHTILKSATTLLIINSNRLESTTNVCAIFNEIENDNGERNLNHLYGQGAIL
jgi:hypothetical protein